MGFNKYDNIYHVLAGALLGLVIMQIISFRRKYKAEIQLKALLPRDYNSTIECDRFRKLIIKFFELNMLVNGEHFSLSKDTIFLNIKDIFPIYFEHYPNYFSDEQPPSYSLLLELLKDDPGYAGKSLLWFEGAAYRPAIELKRLIEELNLNTTTAV